MATQCRPLYVFVLLVLFSGGYHGVAGECAIPFEYKGVTYNGCTTEGNQETYWCSETSVYSGEWETCSDDEARDDEGQCAIPFTYREVTYDGCTTVKNGDTYWCSLTDPYRGKWKICDDDEPRDDEGSEPDCVFPFTYKGVEYNGCTTVGYSGKYWCSVTADYEGKWRKCSDDEARDNDGEPLDCAESFTYKWFTYEGCTTVDHGDVYWCSVTEEYDGYWRNCTDDEARDDSGTPAVDCEFPFKYKGFIYNGCTTRDNDGTYWCSLNPTYKRRWRNCADDEDRDNDGEERDCVFPFTYQGKTYTACTDVNSSGQYWCSLDAVYRREWRYCTEDEFEDPELE